MLALTMEKPTRAYLKRPRETYSKNAEAVAHTVIKKVLRGEKIVMGQIIKEQGYSDTVANKPEKVTKQKAYIAVMQPAVKQFTDLREKALQELGNKDLSKEKYAVLVASADTFTKNIQLLSGGKTSDTPQPLIQVNLAFNQNNTKVDKSNE